MISWQQALREKQVTERARFHILCSKVFRAFKKRTSMVERKQLVQLACAQHIETVRQKLVMAKWKAYVHEVQKYRNFQLAVFTRFDLFK